MMSQWTWTQKLHLQMFYGRHEQHRQSSQQRLCKRVSKLTALAVPRRTSRQALIYVKVWPPPRWPCTNGGGEAQAVMVIFGVELQRVAKGWRGGGKHQGSGDVSSSQREPLLFSKRTAFCLCSPEFQNYTCAAQRFPSNLTLKQNRFVTNLPEGLFYTSTMFMSGRQKIRKLWIYTQ